MNGIPYEPNPIDKKYDNPHLLNFQSHLVQFFFAKHGSYVYKPIFLRKELIKQEERPCFCLKKTRRASLDPRQRHLTIVCYFGSLGPFVAGTHGGGTSSAPRI